MTEPATYCRDIEAYLCRKNGGHLIRIVGPAFEQVRGWEAQGIPFKVACAGIDRYFERYYRKGPRRRPVRVEFCDADVRDAFDDWRRAVGVSSPMIGTDAAGGDEERTAGGRRRSSLASHVERVVARLTVLRGNDRAAAALGETLARLTHRLDALQTAAKAARGDARDRVLRELATLDRDLLEAAFRAVSGEERDALGAEAARELAPFRGRMEAGAFEQARAAAFARLLRERLELPRIVFD